MGETSKTDVIECWPRSEPNQRGYRERMKGLWDELGVFEVTEQNLSDQARAIRTNEWLIKDQASVQLDENNLFEKAIAEGFDEENWLYLMKIV